MLPFNFFPSLGKYSSLTASNLFFVFQKFDYISNMSFFEFINCLWLSHLLESVGLCLLPNVGNFQPLLLRKNFQPHPLPFFSLKFQWHKWDLLLLFHKFLMFCLFFSAYVLFFRLGDFYCSSSSLLLLSCFLHCAEFTHWVLFCFFLSVLTFISKICVWFFFLSYIC